MVENNNKKKTFWEAFVITALVFILGLLIGVFMESSRLDKFEELYMESEISLTDYFALSQLSTNEEKNCEAIIELNLNFADKIYSDALLLEKYEESNSLTRDLELLHKKYDVLRTLLWINTINSLRECETNFSTVVFLYEFRTKDLNKKAENEVWGKILFDLKQEEAENILLIPIAVDGDSSSIEYLTERLNITKYPSVVIDETKVIEEIISVEELKFFLK
jgi:hypothetical protein